MTPLEIVEESYMAFRKYVPKDSIEKYDNQFLSRDTTQLDFILPFFERYLDLETMDLKLVYTFDIYLINYWLYQVPEMGLKNTKLLKKYLKSVDNYKERISKELNDDKESKNNGEKDSKEEERSKMIVRIQKAARKYPEFRKKLSKESNQFFENIKKSRGKKEENME